MAVYGVGILWGDEAAAWGAQFILRAVYSENPEVLVEWAISEYNIDRTTIQKRSNTAWDFSCKAQPYIDIHDLQVGIFVLKEIQAVPE